ncbi:MAG: hypothetical protein FWE25_10115 [Lachnospiraceae bacterium]|nr:hypothetical protein [Lachnospiraceae bacterium]
MNRRGSNIIRLVAGGYLAYLGFSLLQNLREEQPTHYIPMSAVAILFMILGVGIVGWAIRGFLLENKKNVEEQQENDGDLIEERDEETNSDVSVKDMNKEK